MNFPDAYNRLEQIQRTLQSQSIVDVTQLVGLQQEAKECYDICQKFLYSVEDKNDNNTDQDTIAQDNS